MHIEPNAFTFLALLVVWPAVAVYLFSRLPVPEAIIWTILGGFLLLPALAEIKIPMIPGIDKASVPNVAALLGCAMAAGRMPRIFRGFGLAEFLILVLIFSPVVTGMLNGDPIPVLSPDTGRLVDELPAVGAYDGFSAAIAKFVFTIPFFLGRHFLRRPEDNAQVLRALAIAGMGYAVLMLFEIKMSPQLHTWVYGYLPTPFFQQIREGGGFRPVVFLGKGVLVAFFGMTTIVAAAAFWRTGTRILRWRPDGAVAFLSVTVLLCKTVSAILYAAVTVPLVRWARPRTQLRVALLLATIACAYPLVRSADLVPTETMLSMARTVSAQRSESLGVRFMWEHELLRHALERPWFGWGRYGRNRVYTGYDGRDVSITDGTWIIDIGMFGLVGFLAEFGLLWLAVFRAAGALKFVRNGPEAVYLGALALIVAINMVDLLPNSSLSAWTWLLAGGLLGRAEALRAAARLGAPRDVRLAPARLQGAPTTTTAAT